MCTRKDPVYTQRGVHDFEQGLKMSTNNFFYHKNQYADIQLKLQAILLMNDM